MEIIFILARNLFFSLDRNDADKRPETLDREFTYTKH